MRIVTRTTPRKTDDQPSPRMYFVHIPKTAGITLKAFLENNYPDGESLVIDEWRARALPPEALRRYRLFSGHYSSEVLDGLGERRCCGLRTAIDVPPELRWRPSHAEGNQLHEALDLFGDARDVHPVQ